MLDLSFVREQFPSLHQEDVFMDNAGGSQVPQQVIQRIGEYLTKYNVQLGASYDVSAKAGEKLRQVTKNIATYINAKKDKEVVLGPSTTMLLRILSLTISKQWKKGDEVIVTNSDHEANVSCWMDLQEQGIVVKIWKVNPETLQFDLNDLKGLLTERTKLVAMVHASNILGTINPIKEIAEVVHEAGALICVDGVAFAPHRLVDVQDWGIDFYVFSWYKVYGPHQAVMYGKFKLLRKLDSINHYFIGKDVVPYKLQPGNYNYELTYGLQGTLDYFQTLHQYHFPEGDSANYAEIFEEIAAHEEALASRLLDYLNTVPAVRIIGHTDSDQNLRVPTIAFVHDQLQSSDIVKRVDPSRIGIRFGDFYAKKLIQDLGMVKKDGIVRVSLVHYNTLEEVDQLIAVFKEIL